MDVVKAVETYVNKMVATPSTMKVLLLDTHTVCSKLLSQHWTPSMLSSIFLRTDTYCLSVGDTVHIAVTPSLSH